MKSKKLISLAVAAVFVLGAFCACGSTTSEEEAAETTAKATVTAGDAAEKESQDKASQETTKRVKKGTEDPAIDAVKAAAYEDIKDFDGKWKNISVDVGDAITTIEFDWNDEHYVYKFDQAAGKIIK